MLFFKCKRNTFQHLADQFYLKRLRTHADHILNTCNICNLPKLFLNNNLRAFIFAITKSENY